MPKNSKTDDRQDAVCTRLKLKKNLQLEEPKARLLSAWFVTKSRASALKLKRWKKKPIELESG